MHRNAEIVLEATTVNGGDVILYPNRRYAAQPVPDTNCWGVYDRFTDRFLSPPEIKRLGIAEVTQEFGSA